MTNEVPLRFTRATIILIIAVQVLLGLVFVAAPQTFPSLLGLEPAPAWTDWIFAQFGARALGFAYGMALALRDLRRHADWLIAMILVQVIDWIATVMALVSGKVGLAQVATAPFFPILFVAVLGLELRRQARTASQTR